ncbi:MAG: DsbA family oxidoreductase [Alphaproteobacteria bacterium]|nr:DsbA family oxidoreductase [Alphaproteobacteria bacterium]
MRIDVISDTICPWCFVGKQRMERALGARQGLEVEIAWHSFQLNPDMPREGLDRRTYLKTKFGGADGARQIYDRIREAGASEGISFNFDSTVTTPNTVDSHRLVLWAGEVGKQGAVVEALFQRYFFDGANVGDSAVLAEVAGTCGLDRNDVARRLDTDADCDTVIEVAKHFSSLGIGGRSVLYRRWSIRDLRRPRTEHFSRSLRSDYRFSDDHRHDCLNQSLAFSK